MPPRTGKLDGETIYKELGYLCSDVFHRTWPDMLYDL